MPRFWAKEKRGSLEQISAKEDFDRGEKCLQSAIFVNILLIKNKFMKNEHQKKSHIGSLLIRYVMKWFYAAVRTG